jgi:hypothetical protein
VDDDLDERRRMRAWGHPRGTRFAIPKDLWCMRQTAIRKRTQRSRFPPDRRKRSVAPRRMPPVPARFAGRAIYCTFARRRRHAFEDTPLTAPGTLARSPAAPRARDVLKTGFKLDYRVHVTRLEFQALKPHRRC